MIKVGCCGYPVSLKKYREAFNLVEINRTFYGYPRLSTVERWRRESPEGFEFTVKAHQDISHKYKLKLEESREPFERMKEICRILKARILLIQTPASFRPDGMDIAEEFFEKMERGELTVVWETRGPLWERGDVRERLRKVLSRLDVTHVTDPFRVIPVYMGGVAYFRLHGLGERMYYYQYTDEELRELLKIAQSAASGGREVYVLFNNLSMFEDATRFLHLIEEGKLPSLTGAVGLESVRLVVEKTRYPRSKSDLIRRLGWRLVEVEGGRQVRLEELLKDIPRGTYKSPDEVLNEIKRVHGTL